jgi:hypothetical protein
LRSAARDVLVVRFVLRAVDVFQWWKVFEVGPGSSWLAGDGREGDAGNLLDWRLVTPRGEGGC